ncbi:alpha/beta fold hydrolase [Nocardia sp. NPDC003963]
MRGYIDTDWGQVHYRRSGPPPAVAKAAVLLHESPRSSLVYEPIMDALGARIPVFALDTPGFGLSDSAPADATIADYGRILVQAVDALGIDGFVPVGMKTGGFLATEIARRLQGTGRVRSAVLYALERPDAETCEYWAANWAPDLEVTPDGAIFRQLWQKNVGIYGTGSPRELSLCVAEAVANIGRYNSIYPAVFRHMPQSWLDTHALVDAGVEITFLEPPSGRMTPDIPVVFTRIPGTRVIEMPVSGQFPARAPRQFVDAVSSAVLSNDHDVRTARG